MDFNTWAKEIKGIEIDTAKDFSNLNDQDTLNEFANRVSLLDEFEDWKANGGLK